MNTWTASALAFLLISCGDSDKKEPVDAGKATTTQSPSPYEELDAGEGWPDPCDRRTVQTFKLDGATWTVSVPTLCDPTPYIEKGDPPWQNPNASSNEK